jgi:hypothetical protein
MRRHPDETTDVICAFENRVLFFDSVFSLLHP